jgi:hypothetical protein
VRSARLLGRRLARRRPHRHDYIGELALLRQLGTPQSADVRIVERFALSANQSRLDVETTVVDPATFTAPVVLKTY